jgi:ABC-type antimicrobial peptide transport system permease subunit
MASFVAEQRTKEIGIRKVLGATVFNLWQLLSKEFITMIIISLLIAAPVAYYFMHHWLQNYEYRTELSWWIFVLAALGALVITIMTVSFQAIKAATANPVKSLRTE